MKDKTKAVLLFLLWYLPSFVVGGVMYYLVADPMTAFRVFAGLVILTTVLAVYRFQRIDKSYQQGHQNDL